MYERLGRTSIARKRSYGVLRSPGLTLAAVVGLWILAPVASATPAAAPSAGKLPAGYAEQSLCSAPQPGHASCLARALVPTSAQTRESATSPQARGGALAPVAHAVDTAAPGSTTLPKVGLTPEQLWTAYQLEPLAPVAAPQTVAIVDANDDPTIEQDLGTFDDQFGLPDCTTANGCFQKVEVDPETISADPGWDGEISLDVETVHAICQNCKIDLVEASTSTFDALTAAEDVAAGLPGVTEISNSYGGGEPPLGQSNASNFDHPGIVITASAGDDGYLDQRALFSSGGPGTPEFPSSLPTVVGVGGTTLHINANGSWSSEVPWDSSTGGSGGGCSTVFAAQSWQLAEPDWSTLGCGLFKSAVDVAADADPESGLKIYDSQPDSNSNDPLGWVTVGGTSLSSPLVAAMFALAGGDQQPSGHPAIPYAAQILYDNESETPASLHDITYGANGTCNTAACIAAPGFDGATGVGTPIGRTPFLRPDAPPELQPPWPAGSTTGPTGPAPTATPQPTGPTAPPPPGTAKPLAKPTVAVSQLTRLALTPARFVARAGRGSSLVSRGGAALAFTLTAAGPVHFGFLVQRSSHGKSRWVRLAASFTIKAARGVNHARFSGRAGGRALAPGRYELTATTGHGGSRTVTFRVL